MISESELEIVARRARELEERIREKIQLVMRLTHEGASTAAAEAYFAEMKSTLERMQVILERLGTKQ